MTSWIISSARQSFRLMILERLCGILADIHIALLLIHRLMTNLYSSYWPFPPQYYLTLLKRDGCGERPCGFPKLAVSASLHVSGTAFCKTNHRALHWQFAPHLVHIWIILARGCVSWLTEVPQLFREFRVKRWCFIMIIQSSTSWNQSDHLHKERL